VIETYPQLIGYDQDVFNYFKEQYVQENLFPRHKKDDSRSYRSHLCGFDINLTYPETKPIPPINLASSGNNMPFRLNLSRFRKFYAKLQRRAEAISTTPYKRDLGETKQLGKRNLAGRANGTIDPWVGVVRFSKYNNTKHLYCMQYGCVLIDEFIDYAINFTFPWCRYAYSAYRTLAYTPQAASGFTSSGGFNVCTRSSHLSP